MSDVHIRVIAKDEPEAKELRFLLATALEESDDVINFSEQTSQPRGLTGVEVAVSFIVSLVASVAASKLEKFLDAYLDKHNRTKSIDITPLDKNKE